MVVVECSFHQADLLQKSITSSPTDDIPQYPLSFPSFASITPLLFSSFLNLLFFFSFYYLYFDEYRLVPIAVFVRKLNDCIGMMTTAIKAHWWPYPNPLMSLYPVLSSPLLSSSSILTLLDVALTQPKHAEELFECFVGQKFDRSFALVEGTLYTLSPEDPSSPVIDFQNINKRDKKNLEVCSPLSHLYKFTYLLPLFFSLLFNIRIHYKTTS